jgi:hypothetical protein
LITGLRVLALSSHSPFEVGDEFPVRAPHGLQFLDTLLELATQVNDLLFEIGDPPMQLVDAGRRAEPGFPPYLLSGSAPETGSYPGAPKAAAVRMRQQRTGFHNRRGFTLPCRRARRRFGG